MQAGTYFQRDRTQNISTLYLSSAATGNPPVLTGPTSGYLDYIYFLYGTVVNRVAVTVGVKLDTTGTVKREEKYSERLEKRGGSGSFFYNDVLASLTLLESVIVCTDATTCAIENHGWISCESFNSSILFTGQLVNYGVVSGEWMEVAATGVIHMRPSNATTRIAGFLPGAFVLDELQLDPASLIVFDGLATYDIGRHFSP